MELKPLGNSDLQISPVGLGAWAMGGDGAWTLNRPTVTGAIVGARSAEQVDGFVGAMAFRLNEEEVGRVAEELPESITLI